MNTGQQFASKIKPLGCVLFLILFAAFLIMCFTAKAPVEGYVIPHDSEYYATHLDELETELETNLLPKLDGIVDCCVSGDKLTVVIREEHFEQSSAAITHYYGDKLFEFNIVITEYDMNNS